MTGEELKKARGYEVVVKNDLIQKSRYELTATQQKLLLYMISKITPYDEAGMEYKITIADFCQVCNFNRDGGRYNAYVRDALIMLKSKVFIIPIGERKEAYVNWFRDCEVDYDTGEIIYTFSKYMLPYLYELNNYFTKFPLEYILPMKKEYGIRLYEYLKSIYYKKHKYVVDVEELRRRLGCENSYTLFADFRRTVIEPAVEEINKYTDIVVKAAPIKNGRSFTQYEFEIIEVSKYSVWIERRDARNEKLNGEKES